MNEDMLKMLINLGFSRIESEIYIALLKESPLTGYKIAQLLSKSRSNVYQALRSLKNKGGIVELRTQKTKQYKVIPIENIYDERERQLLAEKKKVTAAFKKYKQKEETDSIYNLDKINQVFTKANEMINRAEKIIFIDVQPMQLEKIKNSLEKAARRNVKIAILGSRDYNIKCCDIFEFQPYAPKGKKYENWPMNWFTIAVDAREFLIATIKKNHEDLIYSIWSNNRYISSWIYSDILYEVAFSKIIEMFNSNKTKEQIWQGIEDYARKYLYEAPAILELKQKMKMYNED